MAAYTLTGPTSGTAGQPSSNFTVTVDATAITGTVVVTPNDSGGGGTFTPATLSFTTANQAKTFTYTPASAKTVSINATATQSYTNSSGAVSYVASLDWQLIVNQLLWAQDQNRGGIFFYEMQRDGGMNDATVRLIRDAYLTYKKTRSNAQNISPAYEDTGTTIHGTDSPGDQRPVAWR